MPPCQPARREISFLLTIQRHIHIIIFSKAKFQGAETMRNVVKIIVLVAVAAVLAFVGCKQKDDQGNQQSSVKKYQIAVIPKGTTHVFWKSIHAGALKAQEELKAAGLDVEVIWKGPLKEDDRESQIRVVEDFVTRGVSGIVLAPLDDVALRMPVKDAVSNGIPVVIIDSDLKSEDYASFVATDNYKGGQKGAQQLAKILDGKGKVVMLRYQEGSASTMNREQGFLDTIKKDYPGIEVVSANQYGGATTESAYQASENLLAPLRTADGGLMIDGIFCPNESTAFAMLRALEDSGLAGKVKYVGFDSSDRLVQGLKNGPIQGLVLQDPINMGYLGVKTVVAHLRGEKVEKRIDTGSEVATPENMNDPKMKNLLEPDFKKWLNE
jgi:ribose transport system substrate-binding protein